MSFKLNEPNYNERTYPEAAFDAAMKAVMNTEQGLGIFIGNEIETDSPEQYVGKVKSYEITDSKVTVTADIFIDRISGLSNLEFGPVGYGTINENREISDLQISKLRLLTPEHNYIE